MFFKRWLGFLTVLCLIGTAGWLVNTAATPTQAAPAMVPITVTDINDSFFPDGLCSLREAIHNANTNTQAFGLAGECPAGSDTDTDVIILTSGQTYELTLVGGGNDAGDLDMLGNGLPLDLRIETTGADPANILNNVLTERLIEIHDNATVEIDNINMAGGNTSDSGGGIYHGGASLTLSNVTMSQNVANSGGGIYNSAGVLVVQDSQISFNNGALGGGGIVNSNGILTVTNTLINLNQSNGGSGAGIANGGTLYVGEGTTITDNMAGVMGGGIFNQSGGTVHIHNATISRSTADQGAGLYNDEGTVILENSQIVVNNIAQNGGGGIYNRDVMTLTQTIVRVNTAANASHGGGIYNDGGDLTIQNQSAINLNTAGDQGGGIYSTAGNVTITDSELNSNTAAGDGGGIYHTDALANGQLVVQNSQINDNDSDGDGGGVYHNRYSYFTNVILSGNNAIAPGGAGGGLYTPFTTNWVGGTISGNEAFMGGGLWVASLSAEQIMVSGNKALVGNAGGIRVRFIVLLDNSHLLGNEAKINGGGLYVNDGTTNQVTNTAINNNQAENDGGGIYLAADKHLNLSNSTISGNSAFNFGGGLFIEAGAVMTGTNITLAMSGLGWDLYKAGELNLQNSIISNISLNCNLPATPINSLGHNISNDATCLGLDEPTDMVDTDPMLVALANNGGDTLTHALQTGSPAIGAGNTAVCLSAPISGVDQRGFLRDTVACDIGAYEYGLTFAIGLAGDGVGNVDGKGINCGDGGIDCTIKHEHGDSFPLEATAAAGSVFVGWSGDLITATNPVNVIINTPLHITATFNLIRHNLTVAKAGTGAGLVTSDPAGITCGATCTAAFVEGGLVTLTADPSVGSEFDGWSGAVISSDLSIQVTMDEAKSVTATFVLLPGNFLLTVNKAGTGSGTVTSDPVGIDCGDSCAAGFGQDVVVTLTAVASAGSTFTGWSGAVTSNSASIDVTMDAAKSITATFNDDNVPPPSYTIFLPLISR